MAQPRERQPRTELRIEHIADLMRRFRYHTGKTSRALAKEWGLSLQTLETYTAEASRRVRAELDDPERVKVDVCLTLSSIMRSARKASRARIRLVEDAEGRRVRERVPPDWNAAKVAIDAAKTWALVSGVAAAAKHDVTHHAGDFSSAKDALDYVRGLIPELEAQAANDTDAAKGAA